MVTENVERRESLGGKIPNRILAVRIRSGQAVSTYLEPRFVGPNSNDDLNGFIKDAINSSLKRMEELEDPSQYKQKTYGLRGQRELGDVMENNARMIQQREYELMVLRGERLGAIEVTKDEQGNYSKLEVMQIPDDQRGLWEPIYSASRAAKDNPQALELLVKVFNLRYQMKHGDFGSSTKAEKEFPSFREQLGDFLDDVEESGGPLSNAVERINNTIT